MKFQYVVPILYSADVSRSIEYYIGKLGFEDKWEWDTPPTFGGVSKGNVQVFFCKNGQGNPGTWISVFVDNVDELYKEIKANGAKILSEPEDKEWNVREMLVEDPDGHKIRFGQGIEEE